MKKRTLLIYAMSSLLLLATPAGAHLDIEPISGLVYMNRGLSFEDIDIELAPKSAGKLVGHAITAQQQIVYRFEDPTGLTRKQGKVNLGIRFELFNSAGKQLKNDKGAMGNGVAVSGQTSLSSLSMTVDPRKLGIGTGAYLIKGDVYDAFGSGSVHFEHRFEIVSQVSHPKEYIWIEHGIGYGARLTSMDLEAEDFFLMDKDSGDELPYNRFRLNQHVMMMFGHLTGFTISAGKAYPGVEMRVYDEQGNLLISHADLMPGTAGVAADQAQGLISAALQVTSAKFKSGKRYLWYVKVFDKKSPNLLVNRMWFSVS